MDSFLLFPTNCFSKITAEHMSELDGGQGVNQVNGLGNKRASYVCDIL